MISSWWVWILFPFHLITLVDFFLSFLLIGLWSGYVFTQFDDKLRPLKVTSWAHSSTIWKSWWPTKWRRLSQVLEIKIMLIIEHWKFIDKASSQQHVWSNRWIILRLAFGLQLIISQSRVHFASWMMQLSSSNVSWFWWPLKAWKDGHISCISVASGFIVLRCIYLCVGVQAKHNRIRIDQMLAGNPLWSGSEQLLFHFSTLSAVWNVDY